MIYLVPSDLPLLKMLDLSQNLKIQGVLSYIA